MAQDLTSLGEVLGPWARRLETIQADRRSFSPTEHKCPHGCKDTGFVLYREHVGDPLSGIPATGERLLESDYVRRFRELQVAHWISGSYECECTLRERKVRQMDRIIGESRLAPRFQRRTFDRFIWLDPDDWTDPADQRSVASLVKDQRAAYQIVKEYTDNWRDLAIEGKAFGLFGDPGVAKTHLLGAKTLTLIGQGIQSVFFNTVELFSEIRKSFQPDEAGKIRQVKPSELLDLVKTCEDLSLDDIGTERPTDWVLEAVYLILNHRYEWNLPTAFTTNLGDAALSEQLKPKTYRRLTEPCAGRCVAVRGPSFEKILMKLSAEKRSKYEIH